MLPAFSAVRNLVRLPDEQVGLLLAEHSTPQIPMDRVIAHELELRGSHGMEAHACDRMLAMILAGVVFR